MHICHCGFINAALCGGGGGGGVVVGLHQESNIYFNHNESESDFERPNTNEY